LECFAEAEWAYHDDGLTSGDPADDTVLHYGQTYQWRGWTVFATDHGTRFTNDKSGPGASSVFPVFMVCVPDPKYMRRLVTRPWTTATSSLEVHAMVQ
jgi:hypothetical protein